MDNLEDDRVCTAEESMEAREKAQRDTPAPAAPTGRVVKKSKFFGVGFWIQLAGLALLFLFPLGTIAGIILIIGGQFGYSSLRCSNCQNPVDNRQIKVCPSCRAILQ